MKAIVVGGGIMGLATAWALAREGHAVELFEQGPLPNPLASSMDEHRLIRHPYGDQAGYARMIDQAYAAWDLLWGDLGQRLYAATGTLALTGNGETWAERSAATIGRHRQVDEGDAARRAAAALPAARRARRRTRLLDGRRRRAVRPGHRRGAGAASRRAARRDPARRDTRPHGRSRARTRSSPTPAPATTPTVVVVAAGAWVGRLLRELDRRLVPSRQVVIYFDLPADQRAIWARSPMVIDKTGDVGLYLVPPAEGRGLKIGDHVFSRTGDPVGRAPGA